MSNVDDVLEQCLKDILLGASSVEECLARYPEHAAQLEPLLRTASRVERGSRVRPSPAYRARTRAKLTMHMQAYPHRRVGHRLSFRRLTTAFASVVLTLFVTGTVYAQGVLPGDPFYEWKLTTERAWRLVSSNSVVTDLRIANRRINEMNITVEDHARWEQALKGYNEVRSRLEDEIDAETLDTILPPADVFMYPSIATFTPGPEWNPTATLAPTGTAIPGTENKDKDKDQKDKDKQDKENKGKDKGSNNPALPPVIREPKLIPTIEIPPPAN